MPKAFAGTTGHGMVTAGITLPEREPQGDWVRLRTLIVLRWMAIAGQLAAIAVVDRVYGIQLPLGLCYMAVGVAIVANLFSITLFPENKRLTESEAFLTLLFDLAQLSFLILLTGGLTNPFALLVLAPVTISASALGLRSTVLLGLAAILLITVRCLLEPAAALCRRHAAGGTSDLRVRFLAVNRDRDPVPWHLLAPRGHRDARHVAGLAGDPDGSGARAEADRSWRCGGSSSA
jgi:hypothetical protein